MNDHLRSLRACSILAMCGLSACGNPAPKTVEVVRGLSEAQELFEPGWIADSVPVVLSDRGGPELSSWRVADGDARPVPPRGEMRLESSPVVLLRPEAFRADRVDEIEVELSGFAFPGFIRLSWQSDSAGSASSPFLIGRAPREPGDSKLRIRLELWRSPDWSGTISNLELRISSNPHELAVLTELEWLKSGVAPARLAAVERRPLLVELGHERRTALLLRCGSTHRLDLSVPGNGWLDLGVGALASYGRQARLRAAWGDHEIVLEPSVTAAENDRGWADGRLAVEPAKATSLALSVECLSPAKEGFLFVSTPTFLPEAKRSRRRVVLVSIDTLRADRMSLYGYARPTTPKLSAWAARYGVVFERALAPSTSTLPSHASIFTGLPTRLHGAYLAAPLAKELTSIAEELRDAGYLTFAATGGGFVHPSYGFAQGFDRFRFWPRGEESSLEELPDSIARAREWLDRYSDWPLFLFLHTYEVHGPYAPRAGYLDSTSSSTPVDPGVRIWPRDRFGKTSSAEEERGLASDALAFERLREREPILQNGSIRRPLAKSEFPLASTLYDAGVARMDDLLGPLLEEILGQDRNTTVVLCADHGESLSDHGLWGHGFLYEDNLHVPLVLAGAGVGPAGSRRTEVVGLDSLRATLLELAGLTRPTGIAPSVLALANGGAANRPELVESYAPETSQGIALTRGWRKLIVRDSAVVLDRIGEEFLDLERDPRELESGASADSELDSLRREALRRLGAEENAGVVLSVENRGTKEWTGTLQGQDLGWQPVKWSERPNPRAIRVEGPGRLALSVPPGSRLAIRVQVVHPRLRWRLSRGSSSIDLETSLSELCRAPKTFRSPEGLALVLSRKGPCSVAGVDPAGEDSALRDQLRALGYLQ